MILDAVGFDAEFIAEPLVRSHHAEQVRYRLLCLFCVIDLDGQIGGEVEGRDQVADYQRLQ